MTVALGRELFADHSGIGPGPALLTEVGLDHLRLGRPLTGLAVRECRRLRLAARLPVHAAHRHRAVGGAGGGAT